MPRRCYPKLAGVESSSEEAFASPKPFVCSPPPCDDLKIRKPAAEAASRSSGHQRLIMENNARRERQLAHAKRMQALAREEEEEERSHRRLSEAERFQALMQKRQETRTRFEQRQQLQMEKMSPPSKQSSAEKPGKPSPPPQSPPQPPGGSGTVARSPYTPGLGPEEAARRGLHPRKRGDLVCRFDLDGEQRGSSTRQLSRFDFKGDGRFPGDGGRELQRLWMVTEWRPIPNCDGRYICKDQRLSSLSLEDLCDELAVKTSSPIICCFDEDEQGDAADALRLVGGGGLISYTKPNGSHIHTLGTESGLCRKLASLGVDLVPRRSSGQLSKSSSQVPSSKVSCHFT